jgi:hypothetical protein
MIKSLKLLLIFLLLINGKNLLYSQAIKHFTADPNIFPEELHTFFETVTGDKSQDVRKLLSKFDNEWKTGTFNENQQKQMYSTTNLMLKSQLKPYPYFYDYLKAVLNFAEFQFPPSCFDSLHSSLVPFITGKDKRVFSVYLENTNELIENNCLYKAAGIAWYFHEAEYRFDYDTIPKFVFSKLSMVCYASRDSISIFNTKGVYYPTINLWKGNTGRVTWERAGFDQNEMYAELDQYDIQLRYSNYKADSVRYINKKYFRQPLLGQLTDKVMANTTPENAAYPVFTSYINRIQIVNLFDRIDYDGGYTMEGHSVIGSGYEGGDANVIIKKNNKEFMVLGSQRFLILSDRILSNNASVTIYFQADSIFHPELRMKYIDSEKELTLIRGEEGVSLSPFFDSYHDIDMYFEELDWKLNSPVMELEKVRGINQEGKATFESNNYYSEYRFERLKGIDETNPLVIIKNVVRNNATRQFYIEDLASFMGKSFDQVQSMVITLAGKGFLDYNLNTGLVTVMDKVFKYIDAKSGRTDYDVIQFESNVKGESNASLDINTFDLRIKGVPVIALSDSQKVYIYPKGDQILLRDDRDFIFSGRIHAGLLDFYANNCSFEYDTFKLNMPVIDSLSFSVHSQKVDNEGNYINIRVKSVIRNLNGTLWIDYPQNKSGLKAYPLYPYFTSKDESFVYYNDRSIENGVYDSSSFYYEVAPFTFDSLNTFNTSDLEFKGKLISGGILPVIEYPLKVQDDYSLGFRKKVPSEGYPVYGGKGIFNDTILLSNRGLKGDGTLHYLTATTTSHGYTFYPDSTKALLDTFNIKEQFAKIEYPTVRSGKSALLWYPYADSMFFTNVLTGYLQMYKNQARMDGTLVLTPEGMAGKGKVHILDAVLESKQFTFKQHVFDSDTTAFNLKTLDGSQIAFITQVYRSHVDFDQRKAEFYTGGTGSKVRFPVNQFMCYMNELGWLMDKSKITLQNTLAIDQQAINKMSYKEIIGLNLSGSEFVSLNPDQDSIKFFALKATFDLSDNTIAAEDVKILKVADAAIFPGDGKITIGPNADIKPLSKATIIADTATQHHSIYDATVNVLARQNYQAKGFYDYIDEAGNTQQIFFNRISVDSAFRTIALSDISDSAQFRLSPHFNFKGKAILHAPQQYLVFNGGYRVNQDCITDTLSWVRFIAVINPKNIVLPVNDELTDLNKTKISDAIVLSLGQEIYPAFFRIKERYSDVEVATSKGFIIYDQKTGEFRIGALERLNNKTRAGNMLILNNKNCTLYGDGTINLGLDYGEVTIGAYGNATNYIIPDSTVFNLTLGLDFFFSDDLLAIISDTLASANLKAVNISSDKYTKALSDILGTDAAQDLISEINLYGSLKRIPQALEYTLFFADVNMVWNPASRSYISKGPLGIGNIKDKTIFKYVEGYLELAKRRGGDILNIYLKPGTREWYYFNYSAHVMQSVSSNINYNTLLMNMKEDKRRMKLEDTREVYQFIISTSQKVSEFVNRMQR